MSDKEKVNAYELQIEDMLLTIKERLDEFKSSDTLNEFEQGRQEAYVEIMDIIKTRHSMIYKIIDD